MSRVRSVVAYWLPVAVWMVVIFSASSDSHSFEHSSRILAPVLRWLFPRLSDDAVHQWVIIARKGAHLTEYAILAILLVRALRGLGGSDPPHWSWRQAGGAVLLVALYASSDEFHQIFVPTREASVRDVIIDTIGGMIGLLAFWALGCWRKWWGNSSKA